MSCSDRFIRHHDTGAILVALMVGVVSGCCLTHDGAQLRDQAGAKLTENHERMQIILAESWGWAGFRHPGDDEPSSLTMLEPYQPGKIPVVFIHGLLSAPGTWQRMISTLRSDPDIEARYQFWVFRYSTGVSYLQSASELRQQLVATIQQINPDGRDPALFNMVLVGHSMGGLLAKLQVTHSDDRLWCAISDQPVDALNADATTRRQIEDALFFEPLPYVNRVIFIATPHRGSRWTEHPVGWLGRQMIGFPDAMRSDYQQLVDANFNLLKSQQTETIPTSLDHLDPDDAILLATGQLPCCDQVHQHSIIGTGRLLPDWTWGDGIVAESSARLEGVDTECRVRASHMSINPHRGTIEEVHAILHLHLRHLNFSTSTSEG